MKRKLNLTQEMDLTREGTAEMTRWCIIIALHQCFGVGKDRLNKLENRAEELGYESMSWAMDRLRRCAEDALKEDVVVENVPDEERVKQSDRDYEQQKQACLRRNMAQALGHRAAPAGANVLAPEEIRKKIDAVLRQPVPPESWERRRTI